MQVYVLIAMGTLLAGASAGPALAAEDGKALYASKCAMCHGQDGVPKKMGAGSKAFGDPEFKKAATVESIVKVTHEGVGKMKPVKVTDDQAKAIADYILTIAPKS
jgi:cytochrome c6